MITVSDDHWWVLDPGNLCTEQSLCNCSPTDIVLGSGICVSLGDAGVTERLVHSDKLSYCLLSFSIVFAHLCPLLSML